MSCHSVLPSQLLVRRRMHGKQPQCLSARCSRGLRERCGAGAGRAGADAGSCRVLGMTLLVRVRLAHLRAMQGTEACPQNEDVWLESARLQTPDNVRSVLARAVQTLPHSVKLWRQAAREEPDTAGKQRVLRKALERNSTSVALWKALVELHEEAEARALLARAVECCPDQVELRVALVRLEPDFTQAKKVRSRSRHPSPRECRVLPLS